MGSKPFRAVPIQPFNVRSAGDDQTLGNELVHSQSDGFVSRQRKPPRRLPSLGADNQQDTYQGLMGRLNPLRRSPTTRDAGTHHNAHAAPSSRSPSVRAVSPFTRSASHTCSPPRASTPNTDRSQAASIVHSLAVRASQGLAELEPVRPHTTGGDPLRRRSNSGGATNTAAHSNGNNPATKGPNPLTRTCSNSTEHDPTNTHLQSIDFGSNDSRNRNRNIEAIITSNGGNGSGNGSGNGNDASATNDIIFDPHNTNNLHHITSRNRYNLDTFNTNILPINRAGTGSPPLPPTANRRSPARGRSTSSNQSSIPTNTQSNIPTSTHRRSRSYSNEDSGSPTETHFTSNDTNFNNPRSNNESNNDNADGLPEISRDDLIRNSYGVNQNIYLFLKAQEMGFDRERIREIIEVHHPSTLNDLLRRLISHASAIYTSIEEIPPSDPMSNTASITLYSYRRGEDNRMRMVEQDTIDMQDPDASSPPDLPLARPNTGRPPIPFLPPALPVTSPTLTPTPSPPSPAPTPSPQISLHQPSTADGICVVCLELRAECALIPCGHLCVCLKCGKRLRECPICRSHMNGILKIYRV